MFPEALYRLLERDMVGPFVRTLIQTLSTQGADANQATQIQLPTDRFTILNSVTASATGGGAQTLSLLRVFVTPVITADPQMQLIGLSSDPPAAGGVPRILNWSGYALIPPGWRVRAQGTFSAGAVDNFTRLDIFGLVIPRGNIPIVL